MCLWVIKLLGRMAVDSKMPLGSDLYLYTPYGHNQIRCQYLPKRLKKIIICTIIY